MATKRKTKGSKHDKLISTYAPQRFGFKSIEEVECFYCGTKQKRIPTVNGCGEIHVFRLVELHHIIPVSTNPEMERCTDNIIFLCQDHHREFHRMYDRSVKYVNPNYKGHKRRFGPNQPYFLHNIPATLEDLQEYLGLTAKETIAHQFNWPKTLRQKLGVVEGFFADQELSYSFKAKEQSQINQTL